MKTARNVLYTVSADSQRTDIICEKHYLFGDPDMRQLIDKLGSEWLFCDGGAGTYLQDRGLAGGVLPETWNIDNPEAILDLYTSYLKAGADIINANTFGANVFKFGDDLEKIIKAGVDLALKARLDTGRCDAFIALDMGSCGKLLQPMGDLSFDEAYDVFARNVRAGVEAGVDLILIETMSDLYETKAAVLAAKENSDLPVIVTCVFDTEGRMLTGGTVEAAVALLEGLKVDALGINCSLSPEEMYPVIQRIVAASSLPVVVNPNAGLPVVENGKTIFTVGPEEFCSQMEPIAKLGVAVVGGCCGTTPEHIKLLKKKVSSMPFIPVETKNDCVVSSGAASVTIGGGRGTVVIGERINPTGKKRFKEALRENDIDYIIGEGIRQEDQGADILDVNVGLPEIDEPSMMETVVKELQAVTNLPLQIDTTDIKALERALRIYNGKPMINSVNGKLENIEAVMPLVAKYGGVLVSLTLDEDGIPDNADDRIRIAGKILKYADRYGIPRKDIVIDGLCMTISSDTHSAITTLETVRRATEELGCNTVLGVSNISFGLPAREVVNSNFLTMAILSGLSSAIINPGCEPMMQALTASNALLDRDPQCMKFISRNGNYIPYAKLVAGETVQEGTGSAKAPGTGTSSSNTLFDCVRRGLKDGAVAATKKELESKDSMTIINDELIPALDEVGKGFEKGTVFLPQLLMSADAAKAAFEVIKASMAGGKQEIKGRIILATVKGDIHDIGKNIVKVMLENYGYEVIDLGKDVPPELIVETAVKENIKLVGLSALMTTTVVNMEETIKQLKEAKPDCKTVVGGAVLTQEYADMIGADHYAKDAMATVRYADEVFGK